MVATTLGAGAGILLTAILGGLAGYAMLLILRRFQSGGSRMLATQGDG